MYGRELQNLISQEAADLIIGLRDGDVALLYLYLCRHPSSVREMAAKDLYLPRQRLNEAYERLQMLGLINASDTLEDSNRTAGSSDPVPVSREAPELPEYTADDVKSRKEHDSTFSTLISEAQLIMGRPLSTPDLIKMLGIYDHLDLPPEVMMELMNFVADLYRWKYGERRRPSARAFETEARMWVERGITDFDAAERYIRQVRDRRSQEGEIKQAMKIIDRDFTDTERRYIDQWLDWGFQADVLALAYDKTVTNTRKFSPAYMSRILQNWHEKGLHTRAEILEKDHPASQYKPERPQSAQTIDRKKLEEIGKHIKEFGNGT